MAILHFISIYDVYMTYIFRFMLFLAVKEGETAHLEAKLIPLNDPTMVVTWYINGQPLNVGM